MNGLSGPRRLNTGVRLHMALARPFMVSRGFLAKRFLIFFPNPLCFKYAPPQGR